MWGYFSFKVDKDMLLRKNKDVWVGWAYGVEMDKAGGKVDVAHVGPMVLSKGREGLKSRECFWCRHGRQDEARALDIGPWLDLVDWGEGLDGEGQGDPQGESLDAA